jgi:hypothetical protein
MYVKILWILSEMTHRTKFYIGQACQTGGPTATCNSWLAVAAKLSQQPEYNSFEYESLFGWDKIFLIRLLSESSYFYEFAQRQEKLQRAAYRGFEFHVLRCAYDKGHIM